MAMLHRPWRPGPLGRVAPPSDGPAAAAAAPCLSLRPPGARPCRPRRALSQGRRAVYPVGERRRRGDPGVRRPAQGLGESGLDGTGRGGEAVVIGGGPGGYAAALGLARAGLRVRLVDAGGLGGTCLHRGCIPTKALLESARVADTMRRAAEFGLAPPPGGPQLDWAAVSARRARVVASLAGGLESLLRGAGVECVRGWASLRPAGAGGRPRVRVEPAAAGVAGSPQDLEPAAVVLAPGARPIRPALPGLEQPGVLTSDELLALGEQPRRLCIVGGGAIGCEFASAFADLGTEVTLLEVAPQLLPAAEPEVARRLQAALRRRGVAVSTGCRVLGIEPGPLVRVAEPAGERRVAADAVLVAVGRCPATAGLGLGEAGVAQTEAGAIRTDAQGATTAPGVWAVGDARGGPMLAHAAFAQAAAAVAAIVAGSPPPARPLAQPVFSRPEVAWVGATEAQARAQGAAVRVARIPFAALGRAQAAGEVDGFCKVVADAGGQLLGAHLVGAGATELVAVACVALAAGATARDLLASGFPHPTWSEAFAEAAGLLLGEALHVPPAAGEAAARPARGD
jgi:dihydrolipoamide dehydrogenase